MKKFLIKKQILIKVGSTVLKIVHDNQVSKSGKSYPDVGHLVRKMRGNIIFFGLFDP